jgi:NADPH-dependent ferric siderophore reductase
VSTPSHASVFVAGGSGLATGLRRHLVTTGHDKALIRFAGYWKSERIAVAA